MCCANRFRFRAIVAIQVWAALLVCSLLGRCAERSAVAVPVAEAGQARAVIVIPNAASESTKWAASELQRDLRLLSGAEVPIAPEGQIPPNAEDRSWILVGGPGQNRVVKEAVGKGLSGFGGLKNDGFVVKTFRLGKKPVVVAGGDSDAGTMYAVFALLEQLGVTFRLTGDTIPEQRSSLSVPQLSLRKEPAIVQRGFLVEAHRASIAMLSYKDWSLLFDQMAKMKLNHLEYWWFSHQPDVQYSYRGEAKLIGDMSTRESGYINSMYEGFGSRTTDDVVIGKQWFPGRRLAPAELQRVETPDEAFAVVQDLQRRMIQYAKKRYVKMWLVDEMGSLAPNLARYTDRIALLPFDGVFGTFVDPLDPVNREIQANRLKALKDTYPEGYLLNIPENNHALTRARDLEFFAQPEQQALFRDLLGLMLPWDTRGVDNRDEMVNSTLGYFDLFKYLLGKRDEIAPSAKLGLMTVGRGYVMPRFDKLLPKEIPFATFDTGGPCGYGTGAGMPMNYFGGMGERVRIDSPYLDDDCDIVAQQFNVWVYTDKDRIYTDGVKNGLTGVAPWMAQPRGTEANSSFLAEADWNPQLTREEFYKDYSTRLFGSSAATDIYKAFMTLGQVEGYPSTMECCEALPVVNLAHDYSQQDSPFDGPKGSGWERFMATAPMEIGFFEHSIALDQDALTSLHAAESKVAPQGKHELAYLISRTESDCDDRRAQITERKAYLAFHKAFRERGAVSHTQFVADLEAALQLFAAAREQAQVATTEYARIIDFTSDLEALYHLNVSTDLGFDLVYQWMKTVVDFHRGKLYTNHVPFEKLFTEEVRRKSEE
jgi:hypothetical protein